MVAALIEALSRTTSVPVKARIVANLAGLYHRYPEWSGQWFGTNPLAGQFPRKTADWSSEGMKGVKDGLALALADRDSAVRFQAIVGLSEVGPTASPLLRAALVKEPDATNQAVLAETLGALLGPAGGADLDGDGRRCQPDRGCPKVGACGSVTIPRSPVAAGPVRVAL